MKDGIYLYPSYYQSGNKMYDSVFVENDLYSTTFPLFPRRARAVENAESSPDLWVWVAELPELPPQIRDGLVLLTSGSGNQVVRFVKDGYTFSQRNSEGNKVPGQTGTSIADWIRDGWTPKEISDE